MKVKIALIGIGIVILVQLVVYGFIIKDTIDAVEQSSRSTAAEEAAVASRIDQTQREIQRLEAMVSAIPPHFLAGVDDPEAGFMEFLNFINDPLLHAAGVDVSMRRGPTFTDQPIPHHESQFSFTFPFVSTREAEAILDFIVHQERFPVKLTTLNLRGSGTDQAGADLALSLLIPARHAHPLSVLQREPQ